MKKFILGLMGMALLGGSALLGQAPTAGPKGEPIPAPVKEIPVVGPSCPSGCCQSNCCTKTKTICCPEHYCKEKEKVTRTFGSEKKCLPPCRLFGGHGFDCDHAHCGHAICVRYLVKKVEVCEKDAVRCKPVEVPVCARRGRGCANGSCDGGSVIIAPTATPPAEQPVNVVIPTTNK